MGRPMLRENRPTVKVRTLLATEEMCGPPAPAIAIQENRDRWPVAYRGAFVTPAGEHVYMHRPPNPRYSVIRFYTTEYVQIGPEIATIPLAIAYAEYYKWKRA
jgi:hypothetical protein